MTAGIAARFYGLSKATVVCSVPSETRPAHQSRRRGRLAPPRAAAEAHDVDRVGQLVAPPLTVAHRGHRERDGIRTPGPSQISGCRLFRSEEHTSELQSLMSIS